MCGLSGFWARSPTAMDSGSVASAMADRLRHRGPDDGGVWLDPEAGVALAHRRLAIVDLSDAARDCPRGCTHLAEEPECALDAAAAAGEVDPARVQSFRRIMASRALVDEY